MEGPADIRCAQIVELVTEYLEGGLDDADRTRFEMHVVTCRGCERYVDQMRRTAEVTGAVPDDPPDDDQLAELLVAFRGWHARTLEET